jgi:hypothetical protein
MLPNKNYSASRAAKESQLASADAIKGVGIVGLDISFKHDRFRRFSMLSISNLKMYDNLILYVYVRRRSFPVK